jgi:hypothetical protein
MTVAMCLPGHLHCMRACSRMCRCVARCCFVPSVSLQQPSSAACIAVQSAAAVCLRAAYTLHLQVLQHSSSLACRKRIQCGSTATGQHAEPCSACCHCLTACRPAECVLSLCVRAPAMPLCWCALAAAAAAAGEAYGPRGKEPTRYGDWEVKGRATDFA